jgi:hypothetical protein
VPTLIELLEKIADAKTVISISASEVERLAAGN